MFSKEPSKAISDQYVAVRITGGRDITPDVEAFMERYHVRGYPTLMVMNSAGHVVNGQVGRSADAMLSALGKGDELEADFKALGGKDDVESKTKHATMLADRMLFEEATAALDALVAESPSAAVHEARADLHAKQGETDAEAELLAEMLDLYPAADHHTRWRVRLATMPLENLRSAPSREAAMALLESVTSSLATVLGEVQSAEGAPVAQEAEVRAALIQPLMYLQRRDEVEGHVDWLVEKGKATEFAPMAWLTRAQFQFGEKDFDGCLVSLNKIISDYPQSDEAEAASGAIDQVQKMKAASAGEGDDDDDDDDGGEGDDDDDGDEEDDD